MNKRIQQLADQAGLFVDLYGRPYPASLTAEEARAAYNQFADSILNECLGILQTRDQPVVANAIKEIKEHFGVKQ